MAVQAALREARGEDIQTDAAVIRPAVCQDVSQAVYRGSDAPGPDGVGTAALAARRVRPLQFLWLIDLSSAL
jgi:hypothetical protein